MKGNYTVIYPGKDGSPDIREPLSATRRKQLSALFDGYRIHGDLERYFDQIEQMMDGWEGMSRTASAIPGALARSKSAEQPAWLVMLFQAVYATRKEAGYKRVGHKWLARAARRQIENNKAAYDDWEACLKAATRQQAERFLETQR